MIHNTLRAQKFQTEKTPGGNNFGGKNLGSNF